MPTAEDRVRELEAKLAKTTSELERAQFERDEYRKLYELVHLELERVKRYLRAQNTSEKVDASAVQLAFAEVVGGVDIPQEWAERIAAEENARVERKRARQRDAGKRRGHGRKPLPEHLPVERVEIAPPEALQQCGACGNAMRAIGEETSERIEYRPASLVRLQTARIKYACGCGDGGVEIADLPEAPIERGLAGPGMLAHVAVSKYEDHQPLHRIAQRFARESVKLSTSTLGDWVAQVADLTEPIVDAMIADSLRAHRIHTDDTGIPVLAKGRINKGHVWVYLADDDHVVFRYTDRRKGDGPREFLRGYTGFVQADAANLYDRIYTDAGATEVGCWAHARRKFVEAELTDADRAHVALGFIKTLYEIDRSLEAETVVGRTDERRTRAGPVLGTFKAWLDAEALAVLPKSPIAAAIGYARNQWDALTRFLDDARLRLDNNPAERQLRRVAVGRKNWIFAGSKTGAERGCIIYSLLASCRLHGVNPWEYLRDVLVRVHSHPARHVLDLAPKAWKQQRQKPDAC